MDKETLSNYGWIVICVLVLAVMIALAGPFGNFVADAVKSTTQGLFDVNQNALDAAGIVIDDNGFADGEGGGADGTPDPAPEETPQKGDLYEYGDYVYCYQMRRTVIGGQEIIEDPEEYGTPIDGWQVSVKDQTKTTYGEILTTLMNKPVTDISGTFVDCESLTTAPIIPSSVTTIAPIAFGSCYSLTNITIPKSVTRIGDGAFNNCTSLESITIPDSVTIIDSWAFSYCDSLDNITFEGTVAQWSAITLAEDWIFKVPATYVQCSDGTVSLA